MNRVALILTAIVVAICMPWAIAATDLNTANHALPAGWNVRLQHSLLVIHSKADWHFEFSLKAAFLSFGMLALVGLIIAAKTRQRRQAAPGFEIQRPTGGSETPVQ